MACEASEGKCNNGYSAEASRNRRLSNYMASAKTLGNLILHEVDIAWTWLLGRVSIFSAFHENVTGFSFLGRDELSSRKLGWWMEWLFPTLMTILVGTLTLSYYLLAPLEVAAAVMCLMAFIAGILVYYSTSLRAIYVLSMQDYAFIFLKLALLDILMQTSSLTKAFQNGSSFWGSVVCTGNKIQDLSINATEAGILNILDALEESVSPIRDMSDTMQIAVSPFLESLAYILVVLLQVLAALKNLKSVCDGVHDKVLSTCSGYFAFFHLACFGYTYNSAEGGPSNSCGALFEVSQECERARKEESLCALFNKLESIHEAVADFKEVQLEKLRSEFQIDLNYSYEWNVYVNASPFRAMENELATHFETFYNLYDLVSILKGVFLVLYYLYIFYDNSNLVRQFKAGKPNKLDVKPVSAIRLIFNRVTLHICLVVIAFVCDVFLYILFSWVRRIILENPLDFGAELSAIFENNGGGLSKAVTNFFLKTFYFANNNNYFITFDDCFSTEYLYPSIIPVAISLLAVALLILLHVLESYLTRKKNTTIESIIRLHVDAV